MLRIGDHKQFWSGFFFILLGVGTLSCLPSNVGSADAMGPGYFPMLLGSCLIVLGGVSMLAGLLSRARIRPETLPVGTILSVLAGIWAFALLVGPAGLAVSLLCLLLLGCANRLTRNPLEIAGTYLILLGMTWFIFVHLIQLPIRLFWWS